VLHFAAAIRRRKVCCPMYTQVAINNEVFASLSNKNYAKPGGMLDTWMEGVKRSGVKNAMVIALDDETRQNAEARGVPSHQMHIEVGPFLLIDIPRSVRDDRYNTQTVYFSYIARHCLPLGLPRQLVRLFVLPDHTQPPCCLSKVT
jgi:hypothetical protein